MTPTGSFLAGFMYLSKESAYRLSTLALLCERNPRRYPRSQIAKAIKTAPAKVNQVMAYCR
jgi:hypothetical protein